jgi:hypothetical protein
MNIMKCTILTVLSLFLLLTLNAQEKIKIGIIGLDTSHSPAFIKHINAEPDKTFEEFEVVAAYPYGSKTIKSSYDRIAGYTEEAKKYDVKITSSIEELLSMVDCVMLETNDGNLHLEQAEKVFKANKKMFIDKPIGANLTQTIAIVNLAKKYNSSFFSSSALRFSKNTKEIREGKHGKVVGADCYSPATNEPSHADLYWYGIHGVETLFTVMGKGCEQVQSISSDGADVAIGIWSDGRLGVFRGIREGVQTFGGTVFCQKKAVQAGGYEGYVKLLENILYYFKTSKAPVDMDETLEIYTFMEAVNESKRQGGKPVRTDDVYKKAEKEANKLLNRKR